MGEYKRRFGDRRDGRLVRDVPGLQKVMAHLYPKRTECEVYLHDKIDATELVKYLEQKNQGNPEVKVKIFHAVVTAACRMVWERRKMNRFIAGRRTYERNEISVSFVAKRAFEDHAEESLMTIIPKGSDTIDDIGRAIVGDVDEMRKKDTVEGVDKLLNTVAKIPRPILMLIVKIVRCLDFFGKVPRALTNGDVNYSSVLLTNLGSIKCPAVYHHLNNYGTNSLMIAIGEIHKEPVVTEDGTIEIRDIIDIGATLDERIGDGFYFARSLKLIKHLFAHPELLDKPIGENSGYDYR